MADVHKDPLAGAHKTQLIPGDALHFLLAAALVDAFLQGVVLLLLGLDLLPELLLLELPSVLLLVPQPELLPVRKRFLSLQQLLHMLFRLR